MCVRYFNFTSFLIQGLTVFLLQPILLLNLSTDHPHILAHLYLRTLFDLALKAQRTLKSFPDKSGSNNTLKAMSYKRGALGLIAILTYSSLIRFSSKLLQSCPHISSSNSALPCSLIPPSHNLKSATRQIRPAFKTR